MASHIGILPGKDISLFRGLLIGESSVRCEATPAAWPRARVILKDNLVKTFQNEEGRIRKRLPNFLKIIFIEMVKRVFTKVRSYISEVNLFYGTYLVSSCGCKF